MEITQTTDGKQQTNSYKANNAEDLKKKHPNAYQTYQKYSR